MSACRKPRPQHAFYPLIEWGQLSFCRIYSFSGPEIQTTFIVERGKKNININFYLASWQPYFPDQYHLIFFLSAIYLDVMHETTE